MVTVITFSSLLKISCVTLFCLETDNLNCSGEFANIGCFFGARLRS